MSDKALYEIRVVVYTDAETADEILEDISDTGMAAVGEANFGAVLYEGVQTLGTEITVEAGSEIDEAYCEYGPDYDYDKTEKSR